jgi:DNA-binding MarR family transcriptional regulator
VEDERWAAFGFRVGVLHRLYLLCVRNLLAVASVSVSLVPLLSELYHTDGITQETLSGLVHLDKGSTARAIVRMERKGLVIRKENESNRRQKLVHLTAKAKKMREIYFSPLYEMSRIMSKGLTPHEREQLMKFLDLMTENLKRELATQRKINNRTV